MTQKLIIILLSSVLLLLTLISGCSFKEPVLPSWEIFARVPFEVKRILVGEELVNKDSTIIVRGFDGENDVLFISLKDSLDLREISRSDLSLNLDNSNETFTIDTLNVSSFSALEAQVKLGELLPNLINLVGTTVIIPDSTFIGPVIELQTNEFVRVHFIRGTLKLAFINNLPFPLGSNPSSPNGFSIVVVNGDGSIFGELPFAAQTDIQVGDTAISETLIEDKWLIAPIKLEYSIPVAQTTTLDPLTQEMLNNTGFNTILELENISSDALEAKLESQHFNDAFKIGYSDETKLRNAVLDGGKITINFANHIALSSEILIRIPAIKTATSDTFTTPVFLPANDNQQIILDFNGNEHQVMNPDNPGAILDSLEILVEATTLAPNNSVLIQATDSVSIDFVSDTLFFKSITGLLGQDTLEIDPTVEEDIANYQGFNGSINLSEANLILNVFSESVLENLTAAIVITGYHKNDNGAITDSATLFIERDVFVGGTSFPIDLSGPEIVNLVNILPTDLKFSGKAVASGEVGIQRGDRIWADYNFSTPFKARIEGLTTFESELDIITDSELNDDIQTAADENIKEGILQFVFSNHVPLGGTVRFVLTTDTADANIFDAVYDTNNVILRDLSIAAAPVNIVSGFVTEAQQSEILVSLNRREIRLFKNPPLKFGYQLQIGDTGGFVTLRYSDYVEMNGGVSFKVLIK